MSSGKAVYSPAMQLTPVETPKTEKLLIGGYPHGLVGDDLCAAFVAGPATLTPDS